MIIINKSKVKTTRIRALLEFATRYSLYHDLGVLIVKDQKTPGHTTIGRCHERNFDPNTYEPLTPSAIILDIGQCIKYPRSERYVEEVPETTVNSQEEEILLVLAHELKHLDEFWRWQGVEEDYQSEVDAETHALTVLHDWRNR